MLDWRTKTGISAVSGDHTFGRAALQTGGMETLLRVARAETGVLSLLFLFPNLRIGLRVVSEHTPHLLGPAAGKVIDLYFSF